MFTEGQKEIITRNEFYNSHFARHDAVLALWLMASSFVFAPYFVLVLPFISFFGHLVFSPKLSSSQKNRVKSHFYIPKNMILKLTKTNESYVFSIPLISILFVTPETIKNIEDPINRGNIQHELGHHQNYDMMVLIWLKVSLLIWGTFSVMALLTMLGMLFGYPPEESRNFDWGDKYSVVYIYSAVLTFCIIAFVHHRYAFRREFIADTYAYRTEPKSLIAFLEYLAKYEFVKVRKKSFWQNFRFPTHPKASLRISMQKHGIRISSLTLFMKSFFWMLLCALALFYTAMPPMDIFNFWGVENMNTAKAGAFKLTTYATIFFIGFSLNRLVRGNENFNRPKYFYISALGYYMAIVFIVVIVFIFKYSFSTPSNYPLKESALTLLPVITQFFIWLVLLLRLFPLPNWGAGIISIVIGKFFVQANNHLIRAFSYGYYEQWFNSMLHLVGLCLLSLIVIYTLKLFYKTILPKLPPFFSIMNFKK